MFPEQVQPSVQVGVCSDATLHSKSCTTMYISITVMKEEDEHKSCDKSAFNFQYACKEKKTCQWERRKERHYKRYAARLCRMMCSITSSKGRMHDIFSSPDCVTKLSYRVMPQESEKSRGAGAANINTGMILTIPQFTHQHTQHISSFLTCISQHTYTSCHLPLLHLLHLQSPSSGLPNASSQVAFISAPHHLLLHAVPKSLPATTTPLPRTIMAPLVKNLFANLNRSSITHMTLWLPFT